MTPPCHQWQQSCHWWQSCHKVVTGGKVVVASCGGKLSLVAKLSQSCHKVTTRTSFTVPQWLRVCSVDYEQDPSQFCFLLVWQWSVLPISFTYINGPFNKYAKLRVVHAPGMPAKQKTACAYFIRCTLNDTMCKKEGGGGTNANGSIVINT